MTSADLDAALLDMTDSQIMALLARRTVAREQRKKEQNAARVRKWRNADGNASETQDVTQENEHTHSDGNANCNADVMQTVMQKSGKIPSPTPLPPIPSLSTPPPVHTQAREAKPKVPKPEDVPIPPELAGVAKFAETWATFIVSRRRINEPMTDLAAERLLKRLAKRPADAVEAVDMAIEKQWQGFNWIWFDNENEANPPRRNGFNGHTKATSNGHSDHATLRPFVAGIDEAHFLEWYHRTFPNGVKDQTLLSANVGAIQKYREAHP